MHISHIFLLLGGAALFLFGMTRMGDGLKKASGSRLEPVLYRLSGTPLRGILLGTAVTAVIQSSCATSVMAVGFVNAGMMKPRQAAGVILGSILGTSITGWVVCLGYLDGGGSLGSLLSAKTLTGFVAVLGIFLCMSRRSQGRRYVGDILMGFAVLMLGMSVMSDAAGVLGNMPWFTAMMTSLTRPLPGILAGAAFTALLQSASASVGILQALSVTGAMTFGAALPMLMGAAVGAALPVLLSAIGAGTEGKRTALIYPIAALLGTAILAAVFYAAQSIFRFSFLERLADPFSLAAANTILRLVMLCMLAPFTGELEALTARIFPGEKPDRQKAGPRLEERFIGHPALAIEQSRIVLNAMADQARASLEKAAALLTGFSDDGFEQVRTLEAACDRYEDALGSYLIKLTSQELTERQNREITTFLRVLTDFERISDHALNIAQSAGELRDKQLDFSDEAKRELGAAIDAVIEAVRLTTDAFAAGDLARAGRIKALETDVGGLCAAARRHHIERLRQGQCTILHGFILNDLVTDLERVSAHCGNIAAAMLEPERGRPFDIPAAQW